MSWNFIHRLCTAAARRLKLPCSPARISAWICPLVSINNLSRNRPGSRGRCRNSSYSFLRFNKFSGNGPGTGQPNNAGGALISTVNITRARSFVKLISAPETKLRARESIARLFRRECLEKEVDRIDSACWLVSTLCCGIYFLGMIDATSLSLIIY